MRMDVRRWFDRPVPQPKVPRDWVARILRHKRIVLQVGRDRK